MKKKNSIALNASNVLSGGGIQLLISTLKFIPLTYKVLLSVDERLDLSQLLIEEESREIHIIKVAPGVFPRLQHFYEFSKLAKDYNLKVYLGNLPPFQKENNSILFLQNRLIIEPKGKIRGFLRKSSRFKNILSRLWFKFFYRNVNEIVVQSASMANILFDDYDLTEKKVKIISFVDDTVLAKQTSFAENKKVYDFIYVATDEPYKNHMNLVKAMHLVAVNGYQLKFALVFGGECSQNLKESIDNFNKKYIDSKIDIFHKCSRYELFEKYKSTRALVFPSLIESFGLPLIEAVSHNMDVLASDLSFVSDSIETEWRFDPYQPLSIARCIEDYLSCNRANEQKAKIKSNIVSTQEFIDHLVQISVR